MLTLNQPQIVPNSRTDLFHARRWVEISFQLRILVRVTPYLVVSLCPPPPGINVTTYWSPLSIQCTNHTNIDLTLDYDNIIPADYDWFVTLVTVLDHRPRTTVGFPPLSVSSVHCTGVQCCTADCTHVHFQSLLRPRSLTISKKY